MSKAAALIGIVFRSDVIPNINGDGGAGFVDDAEHVHAVCQRALAIIHLRHLSLPVNRARRYSDRCTSNEDRKITPHSESPVFDWPWISLDQSRSSGLR